MTQQETGSTMEHPTGHGPGTPAMVDVYAEDAGGGQAHFWHEWRWLNGPSEGKGSINVPQKKEDEPGTPIHFHLHDNTGRGFRFDGDAIWVLRGGCPKTQCSDPEIPGDKIQISPNLLKIFDENGEECQLHYRLLFKDANGVPDSYDPDIKNGGTV